MQTKPSTPITHDTPVDSRAGDFVRVVFISKMVRKVAGAVPMREGSEGPEVLLVQSSKVESRWLFPKGGTKKTEKRKEAAARETWEVGVCFG